LDGDAREPSELTESAGDAGDLTQPPFQGAATVAAMMLGSAPGGWR